jgi:hypothetical protein
LPNKPQFKTGSQRVLPAGPVLQKLSKAKSESVDNSSGSKLVLKSITKQNSHTNTKLDNKYDNNIISSDRSSILEISGAIENSISTLKSAPTQSSIAIMQLCDKVQLFKLSCKQFSDHVPPQQRFRFRELLTKFESQCDLLKTSNSSTSSKLYSDLQNTLRDIVNVVQRWTLNDKFYWNNRFYTKVPNYTSVAAIHL